MGSPFVGYTKTLALADYSDEEVQAELKRREEMEQQKLQDAIKLVESAGYRVAWPHEVKK